MVLASVLTGCNNEEEGNEAVENKHAMTITMAMIKGEGTTDEACELVEEALNVITESRLNTHVEISFFTADEYEAKVLGRINEIGNNLQAGEELAAEGVEDSTQPETKEYDEETGREIIEWPAVSDNQFDIVFIDGIDQYYTFNKAEIALGEDDYETGILAEINPTSALIGQYVNSTLLSTATTSETRAMGASGVLAFPNNRDFGTYTYLIVNKELAEKYVPTLSAEEMAKHKQCSDKGDLLKSHTVEGNANGYTTSVENVFDFLTKVHADYPDMTLVEGMPGPENIFYTFDSGVNVGAGNFISSGNKLDTLFAAPPTNVYAAVTTKAYYKLMWQLKQWGQTPSETADLSEDFAIAYVRGNANSIASVDRNKYYVKVTEAPVKSNEYVYDNMFGVTKYSIDAARATEVIELFNTNADFRNIMYYGIEDVHYMVNDRGEREFISSDWNMDMFQTGNLYLLAPASKQTFIDELGEELGTYYYEMSQPLKDVASLPLVDETGAVIEQDPADQYPTLGNWGAGKLLNRDAIDGLLLNFNVVYTDKIAECVDTLRANCAAWNQQLLDYTGDNILLELDSVKTAMDNSEEFKYITSAPKDLETKSYGSLSMRFKYLSDLVLKGEDADPSVLVQYRVWYDSMSGGAD
ncbi:MAG: hypothetical protein IJ519_02020 [Clostridia bacterium]|nr:hypothetical protein [Clostridia bacterium]